MSTVGWKPDLHRLRETIISIVLSLPTVGPPLYGPLQSQDIVGVAGMRKRV